MGELILKGAIAILITLFTIGGANAAIMTPGPGNLQPGNQPLANVGGAFPSPGLTLTYDFTVIGGQIVQGGDFIRGEWVMQVNEQSQNGWIGATYARQTTNPEWTSTEWEYNPWSNDPHWIGPPLYIDPQNPTSAPGSLGLMWELIGPAPITGPSNSGSANLWVMRAKSPEQGVEIALTYDRYTGLVDGYNVAIPNAVYTWVYRSQQQSGT